MSALTTPLALLAFAVTLILWCLSSKAQTLNMGMTELPQEDGGTTTVFYPTLVSETSVAKGPFRLSWAGDSEPERGNERLVVISHGSGGSPWVHTDLARTLVQHGFFVVIPQHFGDNYLDHSGPGPASWKLRPKEVSKAIDRLESNSKLSRLLRLDSIGVFGGSAGGHTALSLAGGEWSPARYRDHCLSRIAEDFSSCVGFTTLLGGNWLDGFKLWIAKVIIRWRFDDDTPHRYTDTRIRAAVAMVPFAADFSLASLKTPVLPLGLIIAEQDVNQMPTFHVKAIQAACEPKCEVLARLTDAGHGAMLSPLPPFEPGSIADRLLRDPPNFARADEIPALHRSVAKFFVRTLGVQ